MHIKTFNLIGFAAPAFALAALGLPLAVILPPMYAELGLGLTTVGGLFMLTRMFDVATDPLFGVLGDRVNTRWGRRRPAMIAAVPLLMLGVYLVFMPGSQVSEAKLLVSMLLLYVGWTLLTLSHTAWASELTTDYDQRSRVMSFVQFAGLLGVVAVMAVPAAIDRLIPAATMLDRAEAMGWLILVTLPVFTLVALVSMKESPVTRKPQPDWREAWRSLLGNRALRRLLLADLLMGLQGGINGAVHFFFVIQILRLPQSASLYLIAIFLTGLCLVPLFLKISYRFGKHRTLCFGAIQSSLATACLFFLPASSFWLTLIVFMMIGVNFGAKDFLMRSMMADVIDQDRAVVGVDRAALFYSLLTLTAKLGGALAIGIVFPILDWVGFDPAGANSAAVVDGVRFVVAAAPTLVTVAVAVIMWNFPIDRATQESLRLQVEEGRA